MYDERDQLYLRDRKKSLMTFTRGTGPTIAFINCSQDLLFFINGSLYFTFLHPSFQCLFLKIPCNSLPTPRWIPMISMPFLNAKARIHLRLEESTRSIIPCISTAGVILSPPFVPRSSVPPNCCFSTWTNPDAVADDRIESNLRLASAHDSSPSPHSDEENHGDIASTMILQENPHMLQVDCHSDSVRSKTLQDIDHFRDFNQSGRILLGNGNIVSLSLWPVVLARANNLFGQDSRARRRRANVIFHLSGAFARTSRHCRERGNTFWGSTCPIQQKNETVG
jgi:hypothetical protein